MDCAAVTFSVTVGDTPSTCSSAVSASKSSADKPDFRSLPGAESVSQFERARPNPPDFLARSLTRLRGLPVCGEALAVFAEGLRRAEHGGAEDYDRRVRQLAALCLRRSCGGAYACAVILYDLNHSPGKEL